MIWGNAFTRKKITVAVLFLLIITGTYWYYCQRFVSTDHAFLNADVVQIATEVDGNVSDIYVEDNQAVKMGDILFQLDSRPFDIAVSKARATLSDALREAREKAAAVDTAMAAVKQREAELNNTKEATKKIIEFAKKGHISKQAENDAIMKLKAAEASLVTAKAALEEIKQAAGAPEEKNAKVREAKAALKKAKWERDKASVYSPSDGVISRLSLQPGQVIVANKPQFALVSNKRFWIDANFKETQISKIRPGQKVAIQMTLYPNKKFKGEVISISSRAQPGFSRLSVENMMGRWLAPKRVPVRIQLLDVGPAYPLQIGTSAKVIVKLKNIK